MQWFTWMNANCAMPIKQRKLLASCLMASTMTFTKPHGTRKYNKRSFLEMEDGEYDPGKRMSRNSYILPFVGQVCRAFFCWYWILGKYQVRALLGHLKLGKSVYSPIHKLSARSANRALSKGTQDLIESFLLQIEREYGEPVATRSYKQYKKDGIIITRVELDNQVLLPSFFSLRILHTKLNQQNLGKLISFTSFCRYWKTSLRFKQMRIRSPAKDICDHCTILKGKLRSHEGKNRMQGDVEQDNSLIQDQKDLDQHRKEFQECREFYETTIQQATFYPDDTACHSFDFQQVVEIRKLPQQPGQWYFFSPFELYSFGIVDENKYHNKHYHLLYTEAQQAKGPNQVVSLLHYYLTSGGKMKPHIYLWADNCGGQNKNKIMTAYLCWLVQQGWTDSIELCFQVKGHTRNSVDRGFGTAKYNASRKDIWTPTDYSAAVASTTTNNSIEPINLFDDGADQDVFCDWEESLSSLFKPLKGIQTFHNFLFLKEFPGSVMAKKLPLDAWQRFDLTKIGITLEQMCSISPKRLESIGLKPEKRFDMWSKYSPYAPKHIKSTWLYTKPSDLTINQARLVKTGRSKQSGNINISNPSIANTVWEEMEEMATEEVLEREEEVSTHVPKRRGRPPESKNKKSRKTL